ncbi:MAG: 2-oxoacid:acceptor oxidoreductase subunit alpha [Bdellovibrionales bacterium]|nr:2-oxoacid:acceptor oxidoreductase subunit alpha [Bdellovibrionales bacterium]
MTEQQQLSSPLHSQESRELSSVAIRFAGDSGDGMQLTGTRFTTESARVGNDLATRPDFPAEIRAPAGTLAGVSAFQIHFGSEEIFTAGDELDVLVAMNPAALKANLGDLKQNGMLICNTDSFTERNLERIGYETNPLDDEALKTKYTVVPVAITTLTMEALKESSLPKSSLEKCKNFFALGVVCHLYSRPIAATKEWIGRKFKGKAEVAKANEEALLAGVAFAEASEYFPSVYEVRKASLAPGRYRNLTGNQGIAFGLLAAAEKSGLHLMYAGYPITPASDILHEVARYKALGAMTFQAEDEIAACGAALGASYGGQLGVTASSGPGILLKQETIGLAVMAELPLVIIDVQRAGPSTGMPTKTEQADLIEVLYGRNGESPVVALAISSPADAFWTAFEACRIALEYMTPVFLLSDGHIGNGSEPFLIPDVETLSAIRPPFIREKPEGESFFPYLRDEKTLRRSWAIPGTPGLEHRIGGIEKQDIVGNISYDPDNHQRMTDLRAERIRRIAMSFPETKVEGAQKGDLLVLSWGSTYGAVAGAVKESLSEGLSVGHVHLRYLNPFPNDLEGIFSRFTKVLVPELNMGQLALLLRARYLRDMASFSKVKGQPFGISELKRRFREEIQGIH